MTDTHCRHAWGLDVGRVRCTLCGVLAHASPTQIEDWRACPRKWKYRRLRHLYPVPENVWAAFGSRAHLIREHWLRSGTWTAEIAASKEGQCVAAGIELWPRPGDALGVEIELERLDLLGDGIPWTFKIDDVAQASHWYDLGDLKTIGKIAYRKTEEELIEDAQRVVYSVWGGPVLRRDTIRSAWSYCQRSPPNAIPVVVESRVIDDRQRLRVINDEARVMIAANLRPLDEQDRNRATCYKYRGHPCAYVEHCLADQPDDLSLDLGFGGVYTHETMSTAPLTLADALAAQAAGGAPLPPMPGAAPALPPVPVAPPRIALTPELETWVAACVAAGHPEATIRAQAEAAMVPAPAVATAPVQQAVTSPSPAVAQASTAPEAPQTPAPARRGRPPKATTESSTPASRADDVRMIAATLAARAVSGPASPEAVVDAYFDVLALLVESAK